MTSAEKNGDATTILLCYQVAKKSMSAAYLLWAVVGLVGGHRFYLGYIRTGVLMLVIYLTGWIFISWAMFELLRPALTNPNADLFDGVAALGWFLILSIVGGTFLAAGGVWWIVDAFMISWAIKRFNSELLQRLRDSSQPGGEH